jgi:hypothetical protein
LRQYDLLDLHVVSHNNNIQNINKHVLSDDDTLCRILIILYHKKTNNPTNTMCCNPNAYNATVLFILY